MLENKKLEEKSNKRKILKNAETLVVVERKRESYILVIKSMALLNSLTHTLSFSKLRNIKKAGNINKGRRWCMMVCGL